MCVCVCAGDVVDEFQERPGLSTHHTNETACRHLELPRLGHALRRDPGRPAVRRQEEIRGKTVGHSAQRGQKDGASSPAM